MFLFHMMSILAEYAVGEYLNKHRTNQVVHAYTQINLHTSPFISIEENFAHQEDGNTIRRDIVKLESFRHDICRWAFILHFEIL